MYLFARKIFIFFALCLTVTIGFFSFTHNTTNQSEVRIIIPSIISTNTHQTLNVSFDQIKCNVGRKSSSHSLSNLIYYDQIFNYLSFVLRSHSVFYCSVPKVATRTLLLFLTYLHIRDDLIPLYNNNSGSNILNIPSFNQTILSSIQNHSQTANLDTISLLQLFLSQLQQFNSSKIDLWSMYRNKIFPFIRLRSLSNPSLLFSSNYLRVLFVRHPFERLASAYIDKITSLTNQPFSLYDSIRRTICRRYSSFYLSKDQKILYQIHRNLRQQVDEPCQKIVPTFEHFIEYFMSDTIRDDVHWKPYSSLCHVCLIDYNFIGKFDTIKEDLQRLIKHLGLESNQWIRDDYFQNGKTKENYQFMFSKLDDRLICYLKRFYRNDFKLFHYRIEDYLLHNRTIPC